MSPRERILALAVGAMLVLMGGFWVYRRIDAGFKQREQTLDNLRADVKQKERQVLFGEEAQRRLKAYHERSLPPEAQRPEQLYMDWLLERVNAIGLSEPKVNSTATALRSQTEGFDAYAFTVSGVGGLDKVTKLLHEFHSVGYLHRIKALAITPRDPKTVSFSMTVEALSLDGAPERDNLHHPPADRLAESDLESYIETICGRNVFGLPNTPPKLTLANATAPAGREMTLTLSASDPDKDDKLTYSWESKDVTGAKFDAASGRLTWTPAKPGEYSVTVTVKDDGVPSRSAKETVKITVTDPPAVVKAEPQEDKPPYDQVQFTHINGITEVNGKRQVWMIDRRTFKNYWLHEGDRFQIGEFRGEVKHIGPLDVEFQWYDRRALVPLGEKLAEDKELKEDQLINVRREEGAS
jgi:hypothetical protein